MRCVDELGANCSLGQVLECHYQLSLVIGDALNGVGSEVLAAGYVVGPKSRD